MASRFSPAAGPSRLPAWRVAGDDSEQVPAGHESEFRVKSQWAAGSDCDGARRSQPGARATAGSGRCWLNLA